ncbi:MAG: GNAT family N-acetyltransferase [Halobacteria archaeon]|nr:GNAT family N-acetyltransferase [Halobacteria archaeon]
MQIREAEVGDETLIIEEFWYPLAKSMEEYSEINHIKNGVIEDAREAMREMLKEEDHRVFILEEEGKDVGCVITEKGERESRKKGRYVSINDLFVKEEYRNQGYGTRLIERVRKWAREENCDYLKVSAEWDNRRVREFYKEKGFKEKQIEFVEIID